jgi:hypothetical protein
LDEIMMSDANIPDILHLQPDFSSDQNYLDGNLVNVIPTSQQNEVTDCFEQLFSSNSNSLTAVVESINIEAFQSENSDFLDDFPAQSADGFVLARQLREKNRELIKTVVQLEQILTDSQEQLQFQVQRSRSTDTLIAQQTESLNKTQEQVNYLLYELEVAQQTSQRQQLVIETLSEQLEVAQEKAAQLERVCALLKENYNDQSHQLLSAEKQTCELRSRLHRQQRYALQYKAALEQHLGGTAINATVGSPMVNPITSDSLVPKVSSILPWSTQQECEQSCGEGNSNLLESQLENELPIASLEKLAVDLDNGVEQPSIPENHESPELEAPYSKVDMPEPETESTSVEILLELDHHDSLVSDRMTISSQSTHSLAVTSKPQKLKVTVELPAFLRARR